MWSCNIQDNIINIWKGKEPRLLELVSDAPIHIITQQISNYLLKKQQDNEYEKNIKKQLLNCLIIEKTIETPEIDLLKPQSNDIKGLIEYQNMYQYYIQKIAISKNKKAQTYQMQSSMITTLIKRISL